MLEIITLRLPASDSEKADLNKFINSHRVLKLSYWVTQEREGSQAHFIIEYATAESSAAAASFGGKGRAERRAPNTEDVALSIEDGVKRKAFWRMVEARKGISVREKISAYNVMINAQIKEAVLTGVQSLAGLRKVNGVGDATISKYGKEMLAALLGNSAEDEQAPAASDNLGEAVKKSEI